MIFSQESFYHRIEVSETGVRPHRQRLLKLDSTAEGAMNPDTGDLVMDYQHYWRLPLLRDDAKINSALFIGAGTLRARAAAKTRRDVQPNPR